MPEIQVVTRFAPSPSGELHLGNARTALFSFLLARRQGGRFLLRIEDTDARRSDEAHVVGLCADLAWLGIEWDSGPGRGGESEWRQSARGEIYERYFAALLARGAAYPCFCTAQELEAARRAQLAAGRPPRYAGTCRDLDATARTARASSGLAATLRFRVEPGRDILFADLVHGEQRFRREDLGDFVIRRDNGSAAFFFGNALDDALTGVTHVLRGEDHLSNTPRQLLILTALGLQAPRYGHLALLTGADGAPLSKRSGAPTVRAYREAGYAPGAILNLLFRLGHSTGASDLLDLTGLAAAFDVAHLQRANARFDPAQLRHWQSEWVRSLTPAAAAEWVSGWLPAGLEGDARERLLRAVLPNVLIGADARDWADVILGDALEYEPEARAALAAAGPDFFAAAAAAAAEGGPMPDVARLRAATGCSGAAFFRPLRAALTGRVHGPELGALLAAMPPERVRARLAAHARTPVS